MGFKFFTLYNIYTHFNQRHIYIYINFTCILCVKINWKRVQLDPHIYLIIVLMWALWPLDFLFKSCLIRIILKRITSTCIGIWSMTGDNCVFGNYIIIKTNGNCKKIFLKISSFLIAIAASAAQHRSRSKLHRQHEQTEEIWVKVCTLFKEIFMGPLEKNLDSQ